MEAGHSNPHGQCCFLANREDDDDSTIERASGEDKGPHVPEPILFDLVRPLGAKRGEREVNVLGLASLTGRAIKRNTDDVPDPLNLTRRKIGVKGLEWAPEIEYAVLDGIALEFELPLNNLHVEAYKAGAQITFGTAFKNHLIHGAQMIIQYDIQPRIWAPTLLYLIGVRLDQVWSAMGMFGARGDLHPGMRSDHVELLSNVTVFANVTSRLVGGLETNVVQEIRGKSSLLAMPQIHYEVSTHWMAQVGAGTRIASNIVLPEAGFRLIREF